MTDGKKEGGLLDKPMALAKDQVLATVQARYFPEIWYTLENWFSNVKSKAALEIGYGLGIVGESLAKLGWKVTLTDPSVAALGELEERFKKASLTGAFHQCEPDKLPFADASFTAIVCVNMLEFSPRPAAVLAEIARILAPGGKAVIVTFNKMSPWGIPGVARSIRKSDPERPLKFLGKDELAALLKAQTGFTVDHMREKAQYLPIGTGLAAKLKLPVAGAFVALVSKGKPKAVRKTSGIKKLK